jgi:HlyD family secretion protein
VSKLIPRPPQRTAQRRPNAGAAATTDVRQIYVLRDGGPVAVPVTQGVSDGRRTEVTGGELREGDLVIVDQIAAAK